MLLTAATALVVLARALAAPWAVPGVPGVDSSASDPASYGSCTRAVEPQIRHRSHWCIFNRMGSYPEFPNDATRGSLKFGRMTSYRGPINGSSPQHLAACKTQLLGSRTHASVAVSTKYLKTYQGGWASNTGACGKCMCISILGADDAYNTGLQRWAVARRKGSSFMGRVIDRCGECPDDAIDILQDMPYSYAPTWPPDNPGACTANALPGPRVFEVTSGATSAEAVGTWTALWQFVPCEWTHSKCASFVASFGYSTRPPPSTPALRQDDCRPLGGGP